MERESILAIVAKELGLRPGQVSTVMDLADAGGTIPFIARYRKEATGGLDEVRISDVLVSYASRMAMEKRREYILGYLEETKQLMPELDKKIRAAGTIDELEDLYLPFKPRKKTLADKARELGLEGLAAMIKDRNLSREAALEQAAGFLGEDVPDVAAALEHAMNILVQEISDSPEPRRAVRQALQRGTIVARVKKGMDMSGEKYRDYFDFSEKAERIASHRVMALLRAGKEKVLSIAIEPEHGDERLRDEIMMMHFHRPGELLRDAAGESLKRHLQASMENEVLGGLRGRAESDSLKVFSGNLEKILLFSPFGERSVIGIDPGIRTGCKAMVIDERGDYRESMTLFLNRDPGEVEKLLPWIEKYSVRGVAVGSGTFGRETLRIVKNLLNGRDITVAPVDEDGASVYSAGETAREEFPDLDVTIRGAVSIGRRFQDPMAELVKIDPKSLGIGQYQHDITPALLKEKLSQTVEWAVNRVGVNVNTAGYHLLGYVAGLDRRKAREIVAYRNGRGRILCRDELKKIKGIGDKAFEQAAGFLRVRGGENPLDGTGVHPESYGDVRRIAELFNVTVADLIADPAIIDRKRVKAELGIRELDSIIGELENRGLDPRSEYSEAQYADGVESIDDVKEGMVLSGVVDNVAAFGAFIDLGIKENGLVHISEVSESYVKDITGVLSVGDKVTVRVLGVDKARKRIALSMKGIKTISS